MSRTSKLAKEMDARIDVFLERARPDQRSHISLLNERRRLEALRRVAEWSGGIPATVGVGLKMLESLCDRGLLERRYVLTRDGRELLEG